MAKVTPTHPGEVLLEDFLKPLDMSANALAMTLHVPASRISEISKSQRSVTVRADGATGQLPRLPRRSPRRLRADLNRPLVRNGRPALGMLQVSAPGTKPRCISRGG